MSNLNSATNVVNVIETAKCCKIEGCKKEGTKILGGKICFIKGFCSIHYSSFKEYGDPLMREKVILDKKIEKSKKTCSVDGCKNVGSLKSNGRHYLYKGLCLMHYSRLRSNGDCLVVQYIRNENRKDNPLYQTYKGIRARCNSANNERYKNYGGRGIKLSLEWSGINGFSQFCKDMGEKPSPKHSVERNDVNGDYSKENCRWALHCEQAINKQKSNKTIGVRFVKNSNRWLATLQSDNVIVFNKLFKTEQEAIDARHKAEREHFGCLISEL